LASAFAASLEMVREGAVEIRQAEPFASLYIRTRNGTGTDSNAAEQDNGWIHREE